MLLFIRAEFLKAFDRGDRQHRTQHESEVRRVPHFEDRRCDQHRQTLSTDFHIELKRIPAAIGIGFIGVAKAGWRDDDAVLEPRSFLIAGTVDRRQHIAGQLVRLIQNRAGDIGRCFLVTGKGGNFL